MILVVCATELERAPLLERIPADSDRWTSFVCGVGVVETTLSLSRFLEHQKKPFEAVVHFGVGGAFVGDDGSRAELLEICMAEEELFGDFGICYKDSIVPLAPEFCHKERYVLDSKLRKRCQTILEKNGIAFSSGTFVTVAGVSATLERGAMLQKQYNGLCENMEGAAVARVCDEFSLPLVELRAISNYVEDRDLSRWQLQKACEKAATSAALLVQELSKQ